MTLQEATRDTKNDDHTLRHVRFIDALDSKMPMTVLFAHMGYLWLFHMGYMWLFHMGYKWLFPATIPPPLLNSPCFPSVTLLH